MKLTSSFTTSFSPSLHSGVHTALRDLKRDIELSLTDASPSFEISVAVSDKLSPETFSYKAEGAKLEILGGDNLGLIYGIYAISEDFLGVPALWYWMDHKHTERPFVEIPEGTHKQTNPPVFKYRGWFMNDEDFLSHWAADSTSGISYEAYQMAYEALLRTRGNIVVPGTSVFADEKCWEWAAQRGLMIAEHHMDNLGLNPHRWPQDVPYNYLTHPQYLDYAWKNSVRAKASHGTKVIWSIGHRGKADRPLWCEIPELQNNPALQGKVLGDVMQRQIDIIKEVDPHPDCVVNTWMEVSELIEEGHLKLPVEARKVWADFHGGTATVIEKGKPESGDGIYYHVAMHGQEKGHLVAWISLRTIYHEFLRYQKIGATHYMLINVSNIRPFFISASLATRWLYDGVDANNPEKSISDFFEKYMGLPADKAIDWYESLTLSSHGFARQEDCFAGDEAPLSMTNFTLSTILMPEKYSFMSNIETMKGACLPNKGTVPDRFSTPEECIKRVEEVIAKQEIVLKKAESLSDGLPTNCRATYEYGVLFQSRYILTLWKLLRKVFIAKLAQELGDKNKAISTLEEALVLADEQHELLHQASRGKWLGYYDCGVVSPTRLPSKRIRWALDFLRGYLDVPEDTKRNCSCYGIFEEMKSYHGTRREKVQDK